MRERRRAFAAEWITGRAFCMVCCPTYQSVRWYLQHVVVRGRLKIRCFRLRFTFLFFFSLPSASVR